jgi:Glycosyl hydrolases family 25
MGEPRTAPFSRGGVTPPTPHTGPLRAVDVSNWTGPLSARALNDWKKAGIGLVIVQAVDPPPGYPPSVTRQQCQAVLDAGLLLEGYVYHWISNLDRLKRELALLDGFAVRSVWADEEDVSGQWPVAQVVDQIHQACAVLDSFPTTSGSKAGVYSGAWWWGPRTGNTTEFSDRPWWPSQYDGVMDVQRVQKWGGWTQAALKQYAGTSALSGVPNVDLDIAATALAA